MSEMFKKFIRTDGKTTAEIKQDIEALLNNKTGNNGEGEIIDIPEEKADGYRAEKIPPRKDDTFCYDKADRKNAPSAFSFPKRNSPMSIGRPMEDVPPDFSRPEDEAIYAKIAQMRRLDEIYYTGVVTREIATRAIINQGTFMADVIDDYTHRAFCALPRPVYGALSSSQLRTYFTWRTDVRRGYFGKTDEPYIQLYCCELLNKIGVCSSDEAIDRLVALWKSCRSFSGTAARDLPRLIKDFYAFNNVSELSRDPISGLRKNTADEAVTGLIEKDYSGKLAYLAERSSYKITDSAFYSESTAELMDKALEEVLTALDGYFEQKGVSLFELICGRLRRDPEWKPFSKYYVDMTRMDGFHKADISPTERYCVKRGQPVLEFFEPAPFKGFIGYVLKCTEAVLRERTGFRHKISANINMALGDFKNRDKFINAITSEDPASVITAAVNGWCAKNGIMPKAKTPKQGAAAPVKVEIDIAKLAKIREESDEIAKKLISADEEADAPSEEDIYSIAERISDDDFSEKIAEYGAEIFSGDEGQPFEKHDFSRLSDEWQMLAKNLDPDMLGTLCALCDGIVNSYCRERGILPEVIFEKINTPALAYINDVIIENGEIVPDYLDNIRLILKCAGMAEQSL